MRSKDKLLTRDWKHKGVTRITSSHKTQPLQCSPGVSVTKHKAQVHKHSRETLSSNIPYSLTFCMFLNVTVFSTDKKTASNGSFWPSSPVRALLSSTQKTYVFSLKKIKKGLPICLSPGTLTTHGHPHLPYKLSLYPGPRTSTDLIGQIVFLVHRTM